MPAPASQVPPKFSVRSGERAAFVSENHRLDERAGKSRAVHRHEWVITAAAGLVDGAGNELFARPGLSANQHRRVRIRDPLDQFANTVHRGRGADEPRRPPGAVYTRTEPPDFALQEEALVNSFDDREQHLRAELVLQHVILCAEPHRLAHFQELAGCRHHDGRRAAPARSSP